MNEIMTVVGIVPPFVQLVTKTVVLKRIWGKLRHLSPDSFKTLSLLLQQDIQEFSLTSTISFHEWFTPVSLEYFSLQARRNLELGDNNFTRIFISDKDIAKIRHSPMEKVCAKSITMLHELFNFKIGFLSSENVAKRIKPEILKKIGIVRLRKQLNKLDFAIIDVGNSAKMVLLPIFRKEGEVDIRILASDEKSANDFKKIAKSENINIIIEADPTSTIQYSSIMNIIKSQHEGISSITFS